MGDSDTPRPRKGTTQGSVSSVLTPPTGLPSIEDIEVQVAIPAQQARRTEHVPPASTAPPVQAPAGVCLCGHAEEAHQHYRAGDDCGACGVEVCGGYRSAQGTPSRKSLLSRLLRR